MSSRTTPAGREAPNGNNKNGRISDEDVEAARHQVERAFQLLGLISGKAYVCPACNTNRSGKVVVKPTRGYWKCYRCGEYGSPIKLLSERGGYSFPDAVAALLDRPVSKRAPQRPVVDLPEVPVGDDFQAKDDSEVYDAVIGFGSVARAQEYYGRWHIDPLVVVESGAVVIEKADALARDLRDRFGMERLIACGLVKPAELTRHKTDHFLLNRDYPVVEPHRRPNGEVVGMQFRPSSKQMARIAAHKAYARERDLAEAAGREFTGRKVDYVPKFLSLRGAGPDSLLGCGLPRIAKLPAGKLVYVVEGFKDLLAARTMRAEAYAIPGVGVMPSEKVLSLFKNRDHRMLICMDGDEAGAQGAESLQSCFEHAEIQFRTKVLPAGQDVTDLLVGRHAGEGCACSVCEAWIREHPDASGA